jgi:hypothetical protein
MRQTMRGQLAGRFIGCWLTLTAVFTLFLIFSRPRYVLAQFVIDNPAKPPKKNCGRTVRLDEVFRIKDDGKNVIFKGRVDVDLSDDGAIFILASDHLFKFSPAGQFVFKTIKEGEGPEECKQASRFFLMRDRLRVLSFIPPKVLDYDQAGRFSREAKMRVPPRFYFLDYIDGKIYGIQDEIAYTDDIHKEGLIESPFRLYEISEDFQTMKKIYDFSVQHYIKQHRWFRTVMVDWAASGPYLFAIHTAGYKIVKFDLRRGAVDRIFARKYERPAPSKAENRDDVSEPELRNLSLPRIEYSFDILRLLVFNDTLWVVTSTQKDNEASWLVDVFDLEGKCIDCFYLQFPPNNERHWIAASVLSNDGFLVLPEENQDGYVSIAKYRIRGEW